MNFAVKLATTVRSTINEQPMTEEKKIVAVDKWEVSPMIIGIAGTGKSAVLRQFIDGENVKRADELNLAQLKALQIEENNKRYGRDPSTDDDDDAVYNADEVD